MANEDDSVESLMEAARIHGWKGLELARHPRTGEPNLGVTGFPPGGGRRQYVPSLAEWAATEVRVENWKKEPPMGVSIDPNLNWRERVLRALQEGQLTTTITFRDTNYLVVLQPYVGTLIPATINQPKGSHIRAICANCGDVIYQHFGEVPWYHLRGRTDAHLAIPIDPRAEPAAAAPTPVKGLKVGQTAMCSLCDGQIVYLGGFWQHAGLPSPKHTAIPHDGSPYA